MPNNNVEVQRKASFFHSLGKVLTESNKLAGNEKYKTGHNILSKEVWIEEIPYAPTFNIATSENLNSSAVSFVGDGLGVLSVLYPLAGSNYQTWFLDSGDPISFSNGFEPSVGWCKPLINPTDVTNESGAPSFGYEFKLYRPDGTLVSYDNVFYDVDYFSGLIRFDPTRTPIDTPSNSGLAFQFNKNDFESSVDKLSYIRTFSNNTPRATAFQYIGKKLSDFDINENTPGLGITISGTDISISLTQSSGLTFSNGDLVTNLDNTLRINNLGQITISGNSIYQSHQSLTTNDDNQSTGVVISYKPLVNSSVKVFINGQVLLLGDKNSDCYFSDDDGLSAKSYDSIESGDVLYFNGNLVGWNLSGLDRIILIYETVI
jgi:hypothetical protein